MSEKSVKRDLRRGRAPAARGKNGGPLRRWITLLVATLLAIGGAAIAVCVCLPRPSRDSANAPAPGAAAGFNLLFITLDTVRADHLGCYGYAAARTPNADRLAATGLRFAQATAPAPLTMTSHATMMTGLDPPSHGARDNAFRLAPDKTTLAEVLAGRGYATAAFVASYILAKRYGLDQGFATYDDACFSRDLVNGNMVDTAINERPATAVTDAAVAWLSQVRASKPFFAWVHYYDAHFPYNPPAAFARQFEKPYDGEIAYVDWQLGRLLELLRQRGLERRTLIVVAADHGEGLDEHNEQSHGLQIYDTTMHVPLILNNPALLGAPRVIADRVVSLADIMPTVLRLLGIPAPGPLDGQDLLAATPDPDRAIYIETLAPRLENGWAPLHGLRRLHDKYILAPRREYYDLQHDPHELNNLATAAAAEVGKLDARLAEVMRRWEPPEQVAAKAQALSPEEVKRLGALGYVRAPAPGASVGVCDPKDMLPLWNRLMSAEISSLQGRHEEAVSEIEKVVQQDPSNAQAWYYASYIYKRCNRMQDAERALREALALNPSANGYVNLAQLLLLRRSLGQEFEDALSRAHQLDAENGGIYIARGDWFALQGRRDEALAEFERAARVDPVNSGGSARDKIEWVKKNM